MSKIDELLKNEKVEWKKLGDSYTCLSITTGLNPRKNFKLNDSSQGQLTSWYITTKDYSLNGKIEFVEGKTARITEEARQVINRRSKLEINDILFSAVGTVGKIAFVDFKPDNFDVNESTFVLKPNKENIVPKYLVYYLKSDYIQREVKKFLKGSTLSGLRKNNLEDLQIPIPSREVQEKIVKTLDNFTNYVTELQAELQARTKQYEYYRDMLLSEEYLDKSSVELTRKSQLVWRKLDEIAVEKLSYGSGASAIDYDGENRYIRITDINSTGQLNDEKKSPNVIEENYIVNEGDILLARSGATVGKNYIHLTNERCIYAGYLIRLVVNREIALPKFVFYCLNTSRYKNFVENTKSKGSQPNINAKQYGKFEIPIVPIEVQLQIVETLDNFQSLLADTKGLLPKEIELRQKQYEYYREKLLDFKK